MSTLTAGGVEQASTESKVWGVDVTAWVAVADTLTAPTAVLLDLTLNATYPGGLSGAPSVLGKVISQRLTALVAGHVYSLRLTFVAGGNTQTVELVVLCPF